MAGSTSEKCGKRSNFAALVTGFSALCLNSLGFFFPPRNEMAVLCSALMAANENSSFN